MGRLKYCTYEELCLEKMAAEKYIHSLKSKMLGQQERLRWIENYIEAKKPKWDKKRKEA